MYKTFYYQQKGRGWRAGIYRVWGNWAPTKAKARKSLTNVLTHRIRISTANFNKAVAAAASDRDYCYKIYRRLRRQVR